MAVSATLEETVATLEEIDAIRADPRLAFECCGRVKELVTQQPIRAKAKPLQRRGWEHYRRCQEDNVPCRQIWLKGRRAGGSDGCAWLIYMHAHNYIARLGQLGTNYKTAANMMEKVKFFGEHDDFPGWGMRGKPVSRSRTVTAEEYYGDELSSVPFSERTDKVIDGLIKWPHGSTVELYTAMNPESARSAGLQGFQWTEFFRAPNGGAMDAGETLNAMIKTVPKRGFTFIGLEGTGDGAQGAGYEVAKSAKWPEEATWWKQWETVWPQNVASIGTELQFTLIFAAWFEDYENSLECTPAEETLIRDTLDADERTLIERYRSQGSRGLRLGAEVETTVWNQLKWRRATIKHECKQGGAEEFKQEYPSNPQEAFRASGSPALDIEGVLALEIASRQALPEHGQASYSEASGLVFFERCHRDQATVTRWEEPIIGCRYLLACDPMSGAEQVTGTGVKDRHSVLMLRDAYKDGHGRYHLAAVVARIKPPCQWESEVVTRQIWLLAELYGGATIAVEANMGSAILKRLANDYPSMGRRANLYQMERFDDVRQKTTMQLGFWTSDGTRRNLISTLQRYVREMEIEVRCPHCVGELMTLVIDSHGKAKASGSNFDDDALALALGLEVLGHAHEFADPTVCVGRIEPSDMGRWKVGV